ADLSFSDAWKTRSRMWSDGSVRRLDRPAAGPGGGAPCSRSWVCQRYQFMRVRRANNADIPFLVEAIAEAEASGSQHISYREIFSLTDRELKDLLTSILSEEIQGCGWSPPEFLIAEQDSEAAACCAAWIEGAGGLSSSIIKSQLLIEFLGQEKWGT